MQKIKFVFFGSSQFSTYVLETLKKHGFEPVLNITSSKEPLDLLALKEVGAEVFVVASFGKILPDELIYMPPHKTLNVHPSLLPKLRGPAPIQAAIIGEAETGVTIQRINDKVDEGPIVARERVDFEHWPIGYREAEELLGRKGGELLAKILPQWVTGEIKEVPQDNSQATYTKIIKKSDADISNDSPDVSWKKVLAYEVWPRARIGELIITKAHLESDKLIIDRVLPPGKKEMDYKDYLRGHRFVN
jgi:methionyl-tRNA formyltransferase